MRLRKKDLSYRLGNGNTRDSALCQPLFSKPDEAETAYHHCFSGVRLPAKGFCVVLGTRLAPHLLAVSAAMLPPYRDSVCEIPR